MQQMEILRRKMEGLSNRSLLERMEDEYGSMHSTASSSAANYASSSKRIIEFPDKPSSSTRQPCKVKIHCYYLLVLTVNINYSNDFRKRGHLNDWSYC